MNFERLEALEQARLESQANIDSNRNDEERNRLSQFATPPNLAKLVVQAVRQYLEHDHPVRFLDPAIGTGVFFSCLLQCLLDNSIETSVGFEIDQEIGQVASRLWSENGLDVKLGDFTSIVPSSKESQFNLVICNPPYVRHHHLDRATKQRLRRQVLNDLGVTPSGLSGLYVYFMLLSHKWMQENAIGAWLIPSEFLDVNYGSILRWYLTSCVTLLRIHRFLPVDVQFNDALVSSCLVFFRNQPASDNHSVVLTEDGFEVTPSEQLLYQNGRLKAESKWGRLFTGSRVGEMAATRPEEGVRLGDLFNIKRGIATGANEFFIVPLERARKFALSDTYLTPILPGPRYLKQTVIHATENGWPDIGNQLILLNCPLPREEIRERFPKYDVYLAEGEKRGFHKRYLTSKRSPWYRQELREPPPILCSYMGRKGNSGEPFRFFRNRSRAIATNTYLLLYPQRWLEDALAQDETLMDIIYGYLVNTPTRLLVREGRSYGGGLHKVEPKELENLVINVDLTKIPALQPAANVYRQLQLLENREAYRLVESRKSA